MVKGGHLPGFEGGLFRNRKGKAAWSIVYNDALPVRGRINFVLAHEFGHYLRHRHELDEFLCSQRDMVGGIARIRRERPTPTSSPRTC